MERDGNLFETLSDVYYLVKRKKSSLYILKPGTSVKLFKELQNIVK